MSIVRLAVMVCPAVMVLACAPEQSSSGEDEPIGPALLDQPPLDGGSCHGGRASGSYCFGRVYLPVSGLLKLAEDLDRDGHLDLTLVDESTGELTVLFGDGTGRLSDPETLTLPARPFMAPYFDPSLLVVDRKWTASVVVGLSFATSNELWSVSVDRRRNLDLAVWENLHMGSTAPLLVDHDGDGEDHMVLGAGVGEPESRLELLKNTTGGPVYESGVVDAPWSWVTDTAWIPVRRADLEVGTHVADGATWGEVVVTGTWAGVRDESPVLVVGLGPAGFDAPRIGFMAGMDPRWLVQADLDGDETDDIVVGNAAGGNLTVARRTEDGSFTSPITLQLAEQAVCQEHGCQRLIGTWGGDFDGDGSDEPLVSMSRDSGHPRLYILSPEQDQLTWIATDAHEPTTGDFNEDGIDDIVFSHPRGTYLLLSGGQPP